MRPLLTVLVSGASCLTASLASGAPQVIAIIPAPPASGFHRMEISKAAIGANPIQLWRVLDVGVDCTEIPGLVMRISQPPQHGSASVKDVKDYPAYPAANPRAKCNAEKVPQHAAYYQASPGFAGEDRVVLQVQTPEGRVNEVTVDVDVR